MVSRPLRHRLPAALKRVMTLVLMASPGAWLASQPARAQAPSVLINELVPIEGESGDIVYFDRVAVGGASVVSLYNRAHRFLAHSLHPGSLLPMAHPSKHHLSQCGIISLVSGTASQPVSQDYRVTVELWVKAGQYRYRLSQFRARPHTEGSGISIRDLYPCDQRGHSYSARQAQVVRAWHRSVQAFIGQLHRHMAGLEPNLPAL